MSLVAAGLVSTPALLRYASFALGLQAIQGTTGAFLAPLVESLGATPVVVSLIVAIDPFVSLIIQPLANAWSDRSRTAWGRRVPFLVIGTLLAVVGLWGISLAPSPARVALAMAVMAIGLNTAAGPFRSALGETVAPERHTAVMGLIGLMQGLGNVLSQLIGAIVSARSAGLPFRVTAGLVALSSLTSIRVLRQHAGTALPPARPTGSMWPYVRDLRPLHWLLAAQSCWWVAMSGIITFAVLFCVHEVLGIADIASPAGKAAVGRVVAALVYLSFCVILFSVPIGRLAAAKGTVYVLQRGLLVLLAGVLLILLVPGMTGIYLATTLMGFGYACLLVLPMTIIAKLQQPGREGAMMSISSTFTNLPMIIGQLLSGWAIQQTGTYSAPWYIGAVFILAAWLCIRRVDLSDCLRPDVTATPEGATA